MDYYSGVPEPNGYDDGNGFNNKEKFSFGSFFRRNSFFILLILAVIIIALIVVFIFLGDNSKPEYNQLDKDSYLAELSVIGGKLEPEFSKETLKYTITADSDYITFTCEASSKKAKVEGCEDSIEVSDDEVSYNIKVTAEDKNVTRYYFTIVRSKDVE